MARSQDLVLGRLVERDIPTLFGQINKIATLDRSSQASGKDLLTHYLQESRFLSYSDVGRVVFQVGDDQRVPVGFFSALLITESRLQSLWDSHTNEEYRCRSANLKPLCNLCINRSTRKEKLFVFISSCFWEPERLGEGYAFVQFISNYIHRWFAGHEPDGIVFSMYDNFQKFPKHAEEQLPGSNGYYRKELQYSLSINRLDFPTLPEPGSTLEDFQILQLRGPRDGSGTPIEGENTLNFRQSIGLRAWFASTGDIYTVRQVMDWSPYTWKKGGKTESNPNDAREMRKALDAFRLEHTVSSFLKREADNPRDRQASDRAKLLRILEENPYLLLQPLRKLNCSCNQSNC